MSCLGSSHLVSLLEIEGDWEIINHIANITMQSMFEEGICQCERKAGLVNALEN